MGMARSIAAQSSRAFILPEYPKGWYLFCASNELRRRPISKKIVGKSLVAFRSKSGKVAVLNARCSHMGADLGSGRVVGESIRCPFHNWDYGLDGQCAHIPAQTEIPPFARQLSYPVEERHDCIFFFNAPRARFPFPFFFDCAPKDLIHAKPFTAIVDCPWYMVGANAVDLQHFSTAHDRTLNGPPVVDFPAPFAHRTSCTFSVSGNSITDRLTRLFAGNEVTLEMTDWGGTLMLVHSIFPRMRTFGMLKVLPLEGDRMLAHVTVFVQRSSGRFSRALFDPINARIRRFFIKAFLRSDIQRLAGTRYNPNTLIDIDDTMAKYFDWLRSVHDPEHAPVNRQSDERSDRIDRYNAKTQKKS